MLNNNIMKQYEKKFKENVEFLIQQNNLNEARILIGEYRSIAGDDHELCSFESIAFIMEGDYQNAEIVLRKGLEKYPADAHLSYNMAYLQQLLGQRENAVRYYLRALLNTEDRKNQDDIYKILVDFGVQDTKDEIIKERKAFTLYDKAKCAEERSLPGEAALFYGLAFRYSNNERFKQQIKSLQLQDSQLSQIFIEASIGKAKRFFILSSCSWGNIYQRMHHIAKALAQFGHEVIYIEPLANAGSDNEQVTEEEIIRWSLNNKKLIDGVTIYTPISISYNGKSLGGNYVSLIERLEQQNPEKKATALVTYMPYQIYALNQLKGSFFHIYDCVDDHADATAFWGNLKDCLWEQELMNKAHVITTTASALFLQRTAIEHRKMVFLSQNAVNESDFINYADEAMPVELSNIPEPRIVYIGAIYEWFDKALFYQAVRSNPDKSFVIIGFGQREWLNEQYPNLFFLGEKRHTELRRYLQYMQIGIIPFRYNLDIVINCDPIKHYEYLACGLPVITTILPEALEKPYTYPVKDIVEFNMAIETCLNLQLDIAKVKLFLMENSWSARAALLCRLMDDDFREDEYLKQVEKIGNRVKKAASDYQTPILKTFEAVYDGLRDKHRAKSLVEEAYSENSQIFYIEKQFIRILTLQKDWRKIGQIIINSHFVNIEIKSEFLCCKREKDENGMLILSFLAIRDVWAAKKNLERFVQYKKKLLFKLYINNLLQDELDLNELKFVEKHYRASPLLHKVINK